MKKENRVKTINIKVTDQEKADMEKIQASGINLSQLIRNAVKTFISSNKANLWIL